MSGTQLDRLGTQLDRLHEGVLGSRPRRQNADGGRRYLAIYLAIQWPRNQGAKPTGSCGRGIDGNREIPGVLDVLELGLC